MRKKIYLMFETQVGLVTMSPILAAGARSLVPRVMWSEMDVNPTLISNDLEMHETALLAVFLIHAMPRGVAFTIHGS
jgi:hypothetical protein